MIYLGQMEAHKGILVLLETLKSFGADKSFQIHFVGGGNLAQAVEAVASSDKRFIYHGYLDNSKIVEIFSQVDLMVFPSLCYENLPTVILESFQTKTPVIASNIGGVSDMVKDGINGYLFRVGDAEDLKNKINLCFENFDALKLMGEQGYDFVKHVTVENYVKELLSVIK